MEVILVEKSKLKEIHCEVALGFVWITLADKPQKFEEALNPLIRSYEALSA